MIKQINKLGVLDEKRKKSFSGVLCVYSTKGLCPTLIAGMNHGNTMPFVVVKDEKDLEHSN